MSLYNILITGANGQVGVATLNHLRRSPGFNPIPSHHADLNINDPAGVDLYLQKNNVHALVNCAAYTAVDQAETDSLPCWEVNASGCRTLAIACKKHHIPLIHFSTDYVYHNKLRNPLKETDSCTPKNVYGASKLAGEHKALMHHPKTIILRTSWVYSATGKNFLRTITSLAKSKTDLHIVNDQIGAPTWAEDLGKIVSDILIQVLADPGHPGWYGTYNCSNRGAISWFEFARYFIDRLGIRCQLHPVSSAEFIRPAERPPYSVLDLAKLRNTFGIEPREWSQALDECLSSMI